MLRWLFFKENNFELENVAFVVHVNLENCNTNVLTPKVWCVSVCACVHCFYHRAAVLAKIAANPTDLSRSNSVAIKTEWLAMTHWGYAINSLSLLCVCVSVCVSMHERMLRLVQLVIWLLNQFHHANWTVESFATTNRSHSYWSELVPSEANTLKCFFQALCAPALNMSRMSHSVWLQYPASIHLLSGPVPCVGECIREIYLSLIQFGNIYCQMTFCREQWLTAFSTTKLHTVKMIPPGKNVWVCVLKSKRKMKKWFNLKLGCELLWS